MWRHFNSIPIRMLAILLLTAVSMVPFHLFAAEISGTLQADTTLTAADSPWRVAADLIVPSGATLDVEAGAVLQFSAGAGIRIEQGGRLNAQGTEQNSILMTRTPDNASTWDGIEFRQSLETNVLSHVNMEYGDGRANWISIQRSKVLIENMTWQQTNKSVIEVDHPSLLVRNCTFPSVGSVETIHGQNLEGKEYLILDGNTFGSTLGYNDVIDFSDCSRPGPVFEVYNNVFTGGGDDALDLDGCDAHIEDNMFMNFHKGNTTSSTSNALATGVFDGYSPTIVVVRNVFVDCDHGVLLKENSFMRAENNTFVNCDMAAVNFSEWPDRDVAPGKGAFFDGNIFWDIPLIFENQTSQPGQADPKITVNHSLLPVDLHGLGGDNWYFDPKFADPDSNFHLLSTSSAVGLGPNGLDMGAYVPEGVSINGEPDSVTSDTTALLTIGGPGITAYRYALDDTAGGWSEVFDLSERSTIQLTGLEYGQIYTVYVKGMNSAGRWRSAPTASRSWRVERNPSAVTRDPETVPSTAALYSAYPNPFNPATTISYSIPHAGVVKLTIYDLLGRTIRVLLDGRVEAGNHSIVWDGRDGGGQNLPSGVCFVHFNSDDVVQTRKIVMVK